MGRRSGAVTWLLWNVNAFTDPESDLIRTSRPGPNGQKYALSLPDSIMVGVGDGVVVPTFCMGE